MHLEQTGAFENNMNITNLPSGRVTRTEESAMLLWQAPALSWRKSSASMTSFSPRHTGEEGRVESMSGLCCKHPCTYWLAMHCFYTPLTVTNMAFISHYLPSSVEETRLQCHLFPCLQGVIVGKHSCKIYLAARTAAQGRGRAARSSP